MRDLTNDKELIDYLLHKYYMDNEYDELVEDICNLGKHYIEQCEAAQARIAELEAAALLHTQARYTKRLQAIVQAINDYDDMDASVIGLINWLESVTPYEDVLREMEALQGA